MCTYIFNNQTKIPYFLKNLKKNKNINKNKNNKKKQLLIKEIKIKNKESKGKAIIYTQKKNKKI